jgi:TATA-binding protein-associated factor Taf7
VRVKLLIELFEKFDSVTLLESGFHQYLYEAIKKEQFVANRFSAAQIFGKEVVAKLIRTKKYRKDLTDFLDELRTSTNFRDRQMYLTVARATFDADKEIYKKHFAKAIGNEMVNEKVTLVKVMIAKLAQAVPTGYSKSTDKIAEHIKKQANSEVNQFLSNDNTDIGKRRFLEPDKITTKMKAEEEDEEQKAEEDREEAEETKEATQDDENDDEKLTEGEKKEHKEITQVYKTVSIRLCNYSMLVRAQQFSSGLSA